MFSLNEGNRFVLCLNCVNMRNGIEGLSGLIRYAGLSPINGDVYLFVNKNRTLMKLLHWERGGFVIYYKRLEKGRITHKIFLRDCIGFTTIRWDELVLLMEGVSLKIRRRNRYNLDEKSSKKS